MSWVLIVWFYATGIAGGRAALQVPFLSKELCEKAQQAILSAGPQWERKSAVCVEVR